MQTEGKVKLSEFLKNLDPEAPIAIGTHSGMAYLYFGKAGNTNDIKHAFEDYLSHTKEKRKAKMITLKNYMKKPLESDDDETVLSKAILIHNACRAVHVSDVYIDKYIAPMKRYVVNSYKKEVDECTAIIVEGSEMGAYWFKEEYDKEHPAPAELSEAV